MWFVKLVTGGGRIGVNRFEGIEQYGCEPR